MIVKLLTEYHLEFLSLKGGCRCSSESSHVKMPHCWNCHATAQMFTSTSTSVYVVYEIQRLWLEVQTRNEPRHVISNNVAV